MWKSSLEETRGILPSPLTYLDTSGSVYQGNPSPTNAVVSRSIRVLLSMTMLYAINNFDYIERGARTSKRGPESVANSKPFRPYHDRLVSILRSRCAVCTYGQAITFSCEDVGHHANKVKCPADN